MASVPSGLYANGSDPNPSYEAATNSSMDHPAAPSVSDPGFEILDWHPAYQSCQRFFLDHAQYEQATQAVCALVNIRLPFQWLGHPVLSSSPILPSPAGPTTGSPAGTGTTAAGGSASRGYAPEPFARAGNAKLASGSGGSSSSGGGGGSGGPIPSTNAGASSSSSNAFTVAAPPPAAATFVSAIPYIRRLVVTGFDKPAILHGFFGDEWAKGVMPFVECERRNYLFAAKGGGWRSCKKQYDIGSGGGGADETVPFMRPLDEARADELAAAEKAWSHWLAMEDWMLGPHAPPPEDAEAPPHAPQRRHADGSARGPLGAGNGGTRGNADMVDGEVDGYA